jgi:hypothetical protein
MSDAAWKHLYLGLFVFVLALMLIGNRITDKRITNLFEWTVRMQQDLDRLEDDAMALREKMRP